MAVFQGMQIIAMYDDLCDFIFARSQNLVYSRDFDFATYHILFFGPCITNHLRRLYFRISVSSQIYIKIKSLRIKNVLQYQENGTTGWTERCWTKWSLCAIHILWYNRNCKTLSLNFKICAVHIPPSTKASTQHPILTCHTSGPCIPRPHTLPLPQCVMSPHPILTCHTSGPCIPRPHTLPLPQCVMSPHPILTCHTSGPCIPRPHTLLLPRHPTSWSAHCWTVKDKETTCNLYTYISIILDPSS